MSTYNIHFCGEICKLIPTSSLNTLICSSDCVQSNHSSPSGCAGQSVPPLGIHVLLWLSSIKTKMRKTDSWNLLRLYRSEMSHGMTTQTKLLAKTQTGKNLRDQPILISRPCPLEEDFGL